MTNPRTAPRCSFVMEQTLGHVTHYRNLRSAIEADGRLGATWFPLAFPPAGRVESLPLIRGNWSVRSSMRARHLLTPDQVGDAVFFHTQVTTLLSVGLLRRIPSVISLDATPINYDTVGLGYGHGRGNRHVENLKRRLHSRPLLAAHALVTWCDWARRSLVSDYGVAEERISVIPPGVPLALWPSPATRSSSGPLRILFVGADFARKGGEDLLRAVGQLAQPVDLHLVTKEAIPERPGVMVYGNVGPNSDLLKDLYATADIFVLPTHADCFPLVIQEAMAAGLPVISTDVGAIGEAVIPCRTGLLIPPRDPRSLAEAIRTLQDDSAKRHSMGHEARLLAERRFDSVLNAGRIVDIMQRLIERQKRKSRNS